MFKKLALSAIAATILATTASAAFAAPKSHVTVPPTGAEAFQDRGNAEDMGR
jgi:hypothetical protein